MNIFRLSAFLTLLLTSATGYTQVATYISTGSYNHQENDHPDGYPQLLSEFNNSTIRANQVYFRNRDQLFINYKRADSLTFDAPLYRTGEGDNYTLEGLAFYQRKNNRYELQFANDYAFFCTSCNNMQFHSIGFSGDTLALSIYWGPSVASVSDHYSFLWQPSLRKWVLHTAYYPWTNDIGETTHTLLISTGPPYTFLDTFNAEVTAFRNEKGIKKVSLDYKQGDVSALEQALRTFPPSEKKHLPLLFSENDMHVFLSLLEDKMQTEDIITAGTVTGLNNIAYYLEQANCTPAAILLLEKILSVFPEREVAHLNLADAYTKQHRPDAAKQQYILYLQQMRKRGLEHKVPQRVKKVLNIP